MKKLQRFLEIISWLVLLVCFGIAIYGMTVLPDSIPIHFNAAGQADGYGAPATLLITPIIMTLCNGLMSLIAHNIGIDAVNLPYKVRKEKRESVFEIMLTMIYAIELEIALLTLWVQIRCFQQNGEHFIPAIVSFLIVLTVTIIVGYIKGYKENKKGEGFDEH